MLHIQKASKALYEYSILNTSTAANTSDSIRNTPLDYNTGKIEVRIIQIYIYLENKSLQLLFLKFVYLKVRKKKLAVLYMHEFEGTISGAFSGSPMRVAGPRTWAILCCFSHAIGRQVELKCSSQDLNRYPYGIPASKMTALPT